jgi:hypothetical protein
MLQQLEQIFLDNFGDAMMQVSEMDKSCCHACNIDTFHFDNVTKIFFKEVGVGDCLRSMDIIHFSPDTDTLVYAEMTGYSEYAIRNNKSTDDDCLEYIRDIVLKGVEFRNKVIHSLFTTLKIANYYEMPANFYSYFFDALNIHLYLVIDLTYEQYIFIEGACIDKLEKHIRNRIEGQIEILNCPLFAQRLSA